jgi:hypothetical protein
LKAGTFWPAAARQRPAGEIISRRERARSADEAVVSDDATGQNNPTPSQGPLDRWAWTDSASTPTLSGDCPMGYCERELKKLGRHISPQGRRLPLTTGLKPYWGKPAVRNFREGRGNVMHGLMPICHEAPKGGYTGRHWPTHWRASSLLNVQPVRLRVQPVRVRPREIDDLPA